MAGFAGLSEAERKPIAAALSAAIGQVFPAYALTPARIEKSFSDAVSLCRALRSEDGRRYRRVGMLSPLHLDTPVHAHMMPVEPPDTDIANDAHEPWASIWTPDQVRRDSFDDLFARAIARSEELMQCAIGVMLGRVSYASLRSAHGALSYDSGLPWQETCSPYRAPGVKASKA